MTKTQEAKLKKLAETFATQVISIVDKVADQELVKALAAIDDVLALKAKHRIPPAALHDLLAESLRTAGLSKMVGLLGPRPLERANAGPKS